MARVPQALLQLRRGMLSLLRHERARFCAISATLQLHPSSCISCCNMPSNEADVPLYCCTQAQICANALFLSFALKVRLPILIPTALRRSSIACSSTEGLCIVLPSGFTLCITRTWLQSYVWLVLHSGSL